MPGGIPAFRASESYLKSICELAPELLAVAERLLRGVLGRVMEPQDLVQSAYLRASLKIDTFEGTTQGELCEWLKGIIWHEAQNQQRKLHYRKRDHRRCILVAAENLDRHHEPECLPVTSTLERDEQVVALYAALEEIPQPGRQILVLVKLRGLPPCEVAERLSMNRSTLYTNLTRSMAALTEKLNRNPVFRS